MRDRLVRFLATGCGVGYAPWMPGTVGSVLGIGYWWLLSRCEPWLSWGLFVVIAVAAIWIAGEAAAKMGQKDPSCIVIDEIIALPLALAGLGLSPWKIVLGFVWFRVFDIWKPPPLRQSQKLPGGLGIVVDDLLAAGYACAATHAVVWAVGRFIR